MASGNDALALKTGASDEQLARRVVAGDNTAFDELVRRYKSRIYNLAYQMCRDRSTAEDWSQEAFVRAYEQLRRFDPARPFAPWLFRVATNVFLNEVRRHSPATVSLDSTEDENDEPLEVADERPSPEQTALRREFSQMVQRAIAQLPENYRMAILLRHVEELEYDEIAQAMHIPVGTAKTYLHRGRERLRALLDPMLREMEGA